MSWIYRGVSADVSGSSADAHASKLLQAMEEVEAFVNAQGPKPDGIKLLITDVPEFHCWVRQDHGTDRYDLTSLVWRDGQSADEVLEMLERGNSTIAAFLPAYLGYPAVLYFKKIT